MNKLRPILLALTAVAVTSLFSVQPAQCFTVTLEQVGANVVATGSGSFNLTGLTLLGSNFGATAAILPSTANINVASAINGLAGYTGFFGPSSFGPGRTNIFASSNSGASVGIIGTLSDLFLPAGYVSGTALSDSSTYNNATFASLGLTPGTYVWSWGDGANQRFILEIGEAVPDGGTTVSLLGWALLGLAGLRRKLGC